MTMKPTKDELIELIRDTQFDAEDDGEIIVKFQDEWVKLSQYVDELIAIIKLLEDKDERTN